MAGAIRQLAESSRTAGEDHSTIAYIGQGNSKKDINFAVVQMQ
jgi:hypothetical protein